jgi:glycosyltransferase involved in cell wall biosynthesis
MAAYAGDDPLLLERAIESVFANEFAPDDFVLVLDGPVPDVTAAVIRAFEKRGRLRVLPLAANVGLAKALNRGLALVRTEWVARADADDLNVPDRFAK